jgi:hypothetical protein
MCRDCDGFGVKMSILDLIDKVANVYTWVKYAHYVFIVVFLVLMSY